jgi:hypothetical protein
MEKNTAEISGVVSEMIARMDKVADFVDSAFPGQALGQGIKESTAQLVRHVDTLAARAEASTQEVQTPEQALTLRELAERSCRDAFSDLERMKSSMDVHMDEMSLRAYEALGLHARHLYAMLLPLHDEPSSQETGETP